MYTEVKKSMKPALGPNVPGRTEAERFGNAFRQIFSVSRKKLSKREAEWQHKQASKKQDPAS